MCYEKLGHRHPRTVWEGHKETIGVALSKDLTCWEKTADRETGISIPGRDPHVVYDDENKRWLLYSTGKIIDGMCEEYVSQSKDLLNWEFIGVCARFPQDGFTYPVAESMTVLKHPLNNQWILIGNWHYALSNDPANFLNSTVKRFNHNNTLGFAGEIIEWNGKWYRSGVMGIVDYWVLGFHEIEWDAEDAFFIKEPSMVSWQF
jgi:beta-xylosidase